MQRALSPAVVSARAESDAQTCLPHIPTSLLAGVGGRLRRLSSGKADVRDDCPGAYLSVLIPWYAIRPLSCNSNESTKHALTLA